MSAQRFLFPHRAFPGIVRRVDTAALPCLLFTPIGTDAGLRHACQYYWNAKKTALSGSGTATSRNYLPQDYPYPPIPSDIAWAWSHAYTQYAADAIGSELLPLPTADEASMHPPPKRIIAGEGALYGSDRVTGLFGGVSGAFGVIAATDRSGVMRMAFAPGEIVWSTTADRYALLCDIYTSFVGMDSTHGETDVHNITAFAVLRSAVYGMGAGETVGVLALPVWLEATGPFVVTPPTVFSPIDDEYIFLPCEIALEVAVEFWVYAS